MKYDTKDLESADCFIVTMIASARGCGQLSTVKSVAGHVVLSIVIPPYSRHNVVVKIVLLSTRFPVEILLSSLQEVTD